VGEQGETDLEVPLVDEALLESRDGDLGVPKEKLSSNMLAEGLCLIGQGRARGLT